MEKKKFHRIYLLLLFSVFFLHLPFLNADPDLHLSASRDAFTDEGLNTSQLRNFINHGSLDFWECDNLVKNPLFNAILFVPLKLFGTHLIIARITILIFIFCLMLLTTKNPYFRSITAIAAITTLLQYYVFQYSHFSLSEMLSTAFILSGIYYLYLFIENKFQKNFQLVFASVFLAASYYSKIQFIYIAPLIPAVILLLMAINKEFPARPGLRHLILSVGLMILLITVYTIFWYLPHREIFDYVLKEEASGKYAALSSMPKTIAFNITRVLFSSNTWIINSLFLSCFIAGCLFWKQEKDSRYRILFVISSCWLLFEFHKLTMTYLPSRYLVSYYFAGGFLSSLVISQLIFQHHKKIKFRYAGFILLSLFLLKNSFDYLLLLSNRQYNIRTINQYISASLMDNETQLVLGPWAPSLTWDSKVISKPVWYGFMNDENILQQNPRIIISEPDEAESNQAYSLHHIDLASEADSIHNFSVGKWKVMVYWMRSP